MYPLPVFNDTGAIREFDELVLSTASDIYHTLSTVKSPLTAISLSQSRASGSSPPSSSQGGTSGGREELNKDSDKNKTPEEDQKQDGSKEDKENKDSPDPDNGPPAGSPEPAVGSKPREIWFNVTSSIMAGKDIGLPENTVFQTLVMDGTLIIEV